jgi:hypothetical protein
MVGVVEREGGTVKRLAVLSVVCLTVLGFTGAAEAGKPETFKIDLSEFSDIESEFASEACGFPIQATVRGQVVITIFSDGPSPIVELDRFSSRVRYTNPATGETYSLVDAGPDIYRDGTVAITGRSVTGSGVIGRVVFDLQTEEILFEAGNRLNEGFGAYILAVPGAGLAEALLGGFRDPP